MTPGDVFATDEGEFIIIADEGFTHVTSHGVYVYNHDITSDYLHSVRAVAVGNLKEALCQLSL